MGKTVTEDPTPETIATYNAIAADYQKSHGNIANITYLLDQFIALLPGNKILDVGCGTGRAAEYFVNNGLETAGIDLSEKLIDISRETSHATIFSVMDMRNLTFPSSTFDGLWVHCAFLHVPKSEALETLRGFNNVLKPSGLLHLSVKNGEGEVVKHNYNNLPRFFAFYTKAELERLVKKAGFTIISSTMTDRTEDSYIDIFARK